MKTDSEKFLQKWLERPWQKMENLDEKWGWNDFLGFPDEGCGFPTIVPSMCGRVIHVIYSGGYCLIGVGSIPYHLIREAGLITQAIHNTNKWIIFGHNIKDRKKFSNLAKRRWSKAVPGLVDIIGGPATRIFGGLGQGVVSVIHPGAEAWLRKNLFQNLERKRLELEIFIEESFPKKSEERRRGG